MMHEYEKPTVTELGDLVAMTQQAFNKVGSDPDIYTAATVGVVVGSTVPSP